MKESEQNFEKSISKEKFLADLKHLRDDFIDELPIEELKPNDPHYHEYKCRGNFIQGVVGVISSLLSYTSFIKDPEIRQKIENFNNYASNQIDYSKFLTKAEIDSVNQILDEVIGYLS